MEGAPHVKSSKIAGMKIVMFVARLIHLSHSTVTYPAKRRCRKCFRTRQYSRPLRTLQGKVPPTTATLTKTAACWASTERRQEKKGGSKGKWGSLPISTLVKPSSGHGQWREDCHTYPLKLPRLGVNKELLEMRMDFMGKARQLWNGRKGRWMSNMGDKQMVEQLDNPYAHLLLQLTLSAKALSRNCKVLTAGNGGKRSSDDEALLGGLAAPVAAVWLVAVQAGAELAAAPAAAAVAAAAAAAAAAAVAALLDRASAALELTATAAVGVGVLAVGVDEKLPMPLLPPGEGLGESLRCLPWGRTSTP